MLGLVGITGLQAMAPSGRDARIVIGMDHLSPVELIVVRS
jgi:hypothetical protein